MTGRGAAGAVEAIFSLLALRDQAAPPTINLDNQMKVAILIGVAHEAQARQLEVVVSNLFGFGGTNGTLFRRISGYAQGLAGEAQAAWSTGFRWKYQYKIAVWPGMVYLKPSACPVADRVCVIITLTV